MPRILLSAIIAAVLATSAALIPSRADAMSVGTAAAIEAAATELDALDKVAYVCRWNGYRRVCWWVPTARYYRPYRYARPYRYYRPYRPYRYYRRW